MSIDLSVYSKNPEAVRRGALAEALRRRGWHTLFLDQDTLKEFPDGALSNELVYGTKKAAVLETVKELLAGGDEPKLEELFENEDVGGCGVITRCPFGPREELGDDLEEQVGPEIAALMVNAKSAYHVGGSAGRTELSSDFQNTLWKTLGELAGGLLEDPQTGKYIHCGPQGERVLAEPDDSEGSPLGELKKYFEAAKAAGFPVEADQDEVNLNTAKLSPADLERLLQFTRGHFPKEDPTGAGMAMMIVEEYQQKKGKAFARENASWFVQLREQYGAY